MAVIEHLPASFRQEEKICEKGFLLEDKIKKNAQINIQGNVLFIFIYSN